MKLAAAALLSGCAALGVHEMPPPPATPEQISREIAYLQTAFFEDDCIDQLLRNASDVSDPRSLALKPIYSVEFPAGPLVRDGFDYALEVTDAHRTAYLVTSGGLAGRYTVRGPIRLARCLQEVFQSVP